MLCMHYYLLLSFYLPLHLSKHYFSSLLLTMWVYPAEVLVCLCSPASPEDKTPCQGFRFSFKTKQGIQKNRVLLSSLILKRIFRLGPDV